MKHPIYNILLVYGLLWISHHITAHRGVAFEQEMCKLWEWDTIKCNFTGTSELTAEEKLSFCVTDGAKTTVKPTDNTRQKSR